MSSCSERMEDRNQVEYDPATDSYYSHHEIEAADQICLAIVETVSAAIGRETTEMEPLYSVLDPDALEAILSSPGDDIVRVSFVFEECTVTASSTGQVIVGSEHPDK